MVDAGIAHAVLDSWGLAHDAALPVSRGGYRSFAHGVNRAVHFIGDLADAYDCKASLRQRWEKLSVNASRLMSGDTTSLRGSADRHWCVITCATSCDTMIDT